MFAGGLGEMFGCGPITMSKPKGVAGKNSLCLLSLAYERFTKTQSRIYWQFPLQSTFYPFCLKPVNCVFFSHCVLLFVNNLLGATLENPSGGEVGMKLC